MGEALIKVLAKGEGQQGCRKGGNIPNKVIEGKKRKKEKLNEIQKKGKRGTNTREKKRGTREGKEPVKYGGGPDQSACQG